MAGENGNGLEAGTKWGTLKIGGPIALVIVVQFITIAALLGALLGIIPSPMTTMLVILEKQATALASHVSDTRMYRAELISAVDYQNMLMRAICYRMSDTKEQAMQCEPGYRGFPEEELKYYERKKR